MKPSTFFIKLLPRCPDPQIRLHSNADASRHAALLVACVPPRVRGAPRALRSGRLGVLDATPYLRIRARSKRASYHKSAHERRLASGRGLRRLPSLGPLDSLDCGRMAGEEPDVEARGRD